jgi:hypothetical protein
LAYINTISCSSRVTSSLSVKPIVSIITWSVFGMYWGSYHLWKFCRFSIKRLYFTQFVLILLPFFPNVKITRRAFSGYVCVHVYMISSIQNCWKKCSEIFPIIIIQWQQSTNPIGCLHAWWCTIERSEKANEYFLFCMRLPSCFNMAIYCGHHLPKDQLSFVCTL